LNVTLGVVIPTHDRAAWVVECVRSVLGQTRAPDAITIVDDGSTDDTPAALAGFGDRVEVHRQPQAGPASAKNAGAARTATDWIAFVDSDDRLVPHALETLETTLGRRPGDDLLSFKAAETTAAGTPTGRVFGKRSAGTAYSTAGLLRYDAGGCSWFAVRRAAFDAVGGFDERLRSAEECDFVLRLSAEHRLSAILEPLVLRRQHPGMLSADLELNARSWLAILERLRADRPDWVREHVPVFDRSWGKEHLRLARALLAAGRDVSEARRALRVATAHRPLHLRSWAYRARAAFGSGRG
jgi:glycosyltransferase involved in cell wall biosynthesis